MIYVEDGEESVLVYADETKIDISVRYWSQSVKLEDHAGGSYYYFRSVEEIKVIRDMLNKVLELNPSIKSHLS